MTTRWAAIGRGPRFGSFSTSSSRSSCSGPPTTRSPTAAVRPPRSGAAATSGSQGDIFTVLEQFCLDGYEKMVGLDLENLTVEGCLTRAPCGGEADGRSPVDRGKQGTKRSVLTEGAGIPLGTVVAPANRHDSPLLRPTLETLSRFGFDPPETITVHLDAGYDLKATRGLLDELGCEPRIATKGVPAPIQNTKRWVVERTNAWHNRGFKKLAICTEKGTRVIEAFIALANAIIITRRLSERPGSATVGMGEQLDVPEPIGGTS